MSELTRGSIWCNNGGPQWFRLKGALTRSWQGGDGIEFASPMVELLDRFAPEAQRRFVDGLSHCRSFRQQCVQLGAAQIMSRLHQRTDETMGFGGHDHPVDRDGACEQGRHLRFFYARPSSHRGGDYGIEMGST